MLTLTHKYIDGKPHTSPVDWEAVEYTDCFSAEGYVPPHNGCSWYDTKQSDGEAPVMLEISRMRSTPSLPSLIGSLWPGELVPDGVLFMDKPELNWIIRFIWIVWNELFFEIQTVYLC